MGSITFVDKVTTIATDWLNEVDTLVHGIFGGATTDAEARTNLGFSDPILDKEAPGAIGGTTPAAGDFTTLMATSTSETGDPGTEAGGVNINGTTYDSRAKINDIGGDTPAQLVIHRHSTTWPSAIVGSRANSDTTAHSPVTASQGLLTLYGSGWTGTHYDLFGSASFDVSASGTISSTSSPGKFVVATTPDGSNTPTTALTIEQDQSATFTGNVEGNVLSTGSTTARALTDRFADVVNVKDFGAVGDGVTDDSSAFQAAVTATVDGTSPIIFIPTGSYEGALAGIAVGTRNVIWTELGDITYTTSRPPGTFLFSSYLGDARAASVGSVLFGDGTTDGTTTDRPVVRVQRDASHTGGTTGGSSENSAVSIQTNVGSNVSNYETAFIAVLDSSSSAAGTPNFVGAHVEAYASSGSANNSVFGANIVAKDFTTQASSVSGVACIGLEIALVASNTDASDIRVGLDVIGRQETGGGTALSMAHGIRVRPANTDGAITMKQGITVYEGTQAGNTIQTGILIDSTQGNMTAGVKLTGNASMGLQLTGSYANEAIRIPANENIKLEGTTANGTHLVFNSSNNYLEFWRGGARRGYIDMTGSDHAL